MEVIDTVLGVVKVLKPHIFVDDRGSFYESYNTQNLGRLGIARTFVQDNIAVSQYEGTVRGLHFQLPPHAQAKLVSVVRGSILDVVVDLREGEPSFGHHASFELSADNRLQVFVPDGFAHGYCTLMPDTEVHYKVDAYYAPASERGLRWSDPALGITWPVTEAGAICSARDRALPTLAEWLATPT